ncbi:MAG: hypothetical protein IPL26_16165 [Leptospiraceae bacterium]|nr:hypothetical protein [Leptospiraceae bacterium]
MLFSQKGYSRFPKEDFPELTKEDILAYLAYNADLERTVRNLAA